MVSADEEYDRLHGVDGHTQASEGVGPDGFTRLAGYVAEYVNASPAALQARLAEAQWNALEMARKADAAERRAEEAEFHVEQLRDARDRAERRIEAVETLFGGGPDTPCRTTWREHSPYGCYDRTECVEVPMDDLRRALDSPS